MTDIPLSYPVIDVHLHDVRLNQSELIWDPTKETGVYIRVHCISTEFTAKKHGGEKGVPFRIQVETYSQGEDSKLLHCASCQVKVFKPKGTDRKHKTDREKMEKRSEAEKVPLAQVLAAQAQQLLKSPTSISTTVCPISPVHSRIPESTTPQSPLPTSPASPPTPSHISTRVTTPQTVTADVDPIAGVGCTWNCFEILLVAIQPCIFLDEISDYGSLIRNEIVLKELSLPK